VGQPEIPAGRHPLRPGGLADRRHCPGRFLVPLDAVEKGVEQDQPADASRCDKGCVQDDQATHRQSDQERPCDAEVIEQREQIAAVRVGHGGRRPARPTVASRVVANNIGDVCQDGYLFVPHARVEGETMHEHDRLTAAVGLIGELGSADG
jgi:hypothetical protein